MAKPEWGAKRICHNCGARYYDMQRDPIICPKCGTEFDPEAFLKSRRTRVAAVEELAPKARRKGKEDPEDQVEDEAEDTEEEDADQDEADLETGDEDKTAGDGDEDENEDEDETDEDLEAADDDVLLEDADELGDDVVDVDVDKEEEDR